MKYRITFWTPPTPRSTSHSETMEIEAKDFDDARKKVLDNVVSKGQLRLTGFDTDDSFGGLDFDYYEIGKKTKHQFRKEIEKLISRVERV